MKITAALFLLLGIWLGGSIIVGGVVAYNISGFEHLFARNAKLEARAGFSPDDVEAKKTSVLWVHSSELNRVFFEVWNRSQLVIGALSILLAALGRTGRLGLGLLVAATALVAVVHLVLEPQLVDLGRQLDFLSRDPRPPVEESFQRYHLLYMATESLRLGVLLLATLVLMIRPMRRVEAT